VRAEVEVEVEDALIGYIRFDAFLTRGPESRTGRPLRVGEKINENQVRT
jgi:hypothetical protein